MYPLLSNFSPTVIKNSILCPKREREGKKEREREGERERED